MLTIRQAILLAPIPLALIGSLILPTPSAAAETTLKDLAVVQRPLAEANPPQSQLQVSAWVDHPDNTYRPGENVVLSVKSNQDAYLTIIDVGTSGKVHIIFPNDYQTNNYIRAGQQVQVPSPDADFDFQVSGPAGSELIKVIASTNPEPLFDTASTQPAGPYKALKAAAPAVAKDLQVVWRQRPDEQWDAYNKVIRIVTSR